MLAIYTCWVQVLLSLAHDAFLPCEYCSMLLFLFMVGTSTVVLEEIRQNPSLNHEFLTRHKAFLCTIYGHQQASTAQLSHSPSLSTRRENTQTVTPSWNLKYKSDRKLTWIWRRFHNSVSYQDWGLCSPSFHHHSSRHSDVKATIRRTKANIQISFISSSIFEMVNSYKKQKHIQWNAITVTLIVYISVATEKNHVFS